MYKVFIVDDEMIVRHAIKSMIPWEEGVYEFAGTASNGKKALASIRQHNPDIVITDIKMPDMDGIELIKALKAEKFQGEIVVLSNHQDFELVKEAMKCGIHDYVLKLTVQSQDFMKILAELSKKIDLRKRTDLIVSSREETQEAQFNIDSLKRFIMSSLMTMDEMTDLGDLPLLKSEERLLVFNIISHNCSDQTGQNLIDIINPIVDELLRSSLRHTVVQIDYRRNLVCAIYANDEYNKISEQLAVRMINLASMYYNKRISIVYGQPAFSYNQLAKELQLSEDVAALFFYESYEGACLSNRLQIMYDENQINVSDFNEMSRSLEELWGDDPKNFISGLSNWFEKGARFSYAPRLLKKILMRMLWKMEKALMITHRYKEGANIDVTWEEAIYAASSEEECIEIIRNKFEYMHEIENMQGEVSKVEVKQALYYITQHFSQKISITDVAQHVNLSEAYLCKVFKSEVGKSIVSYLNEIRLQKAHELLSSGQLLIKEAAAAVGIDDQFYFNRLFKRYYGITPKEVKK